MWMPGYAGKVVGNLVVGLRDVASLCMRAVDVVVAS